MGWVWRSGGERDAEEVSGGLVEREGELQYISGVCDGWRREGHGREGSFFGWRGVTGTKGAQH